MKKQYIVPDTTVLVAGTQTGLMDFSQLNVNLSDEGDQKEAEAKRAGWSAWDDEENPLDNLPRVFPDIWGEEW